MITGLASPSNKPLPARRVPPRWICKRMEGYGDDPESQRQFGLEVVTQLCQTLIDSGAPGIHFYTMNQVEPTRAIYNSLGL